MNEKERNEKEATDKASEAAASLSQFAAKPIKVMSSCRGRLRWGWEWGGCCLAMIWGWQTQPHTQSTRAEPPQQPLPRGQTKPNPNPSPSQTRHGQVLYALRVRSISCLGHVLDSDSDLPWLEWRLVDFNSLFHSHSPSAFAKLHTFIEAAAATKNASNCALLATRPQMPSSWQAGCLRLPS